MNSPANAIRHGERLLGNSRLLIGRFRMYRSDFGLWRAAQLAISDRRGRTGTLEVSWPGYGYPFRLRAGGSDLLTFHQVIVRNGYQFPFELNRDPETIIDAGANIGMSAIWFAQRYPGARVIAVEPEDANFEQLLENTANYPNVIPIKAAVWPKSALLKVYEAAGGSFSFRVESLGVTEGGPRVKAASIRDLMAEHDLEFVDVLKIDIEGSEKELFEGDPEWLSRVGAIAIELHDRFKPGCRDAFEAATSEFTVRITNHDETFVKRPTDIRLSGSATSESKECQ